MIKTKLNSTIVCTCNVIFFPCSPFSLVLEGHNLVNLAVSVVDVRDDLVKGFHLQQEVSVVLVREGEGAVSGQPGHAGDMGHLDEANAL